MNLFEILNLDGEELTVELLKELARKVEPFLKTSGIAGHGKALYRGAGGSPLTFPEEKTVRADRKPLNMNVQLSTMFDEAFLQIHGHRYRSNAMFCTPVESTAYMYGNVHEVIPIGPYTVCSSTSIDDLYDRLPKILLGLNRPIHSLFKFVKDRDPELFEKLNIEFGWEETAPTVMFNNVLSVDPDMIKEYVNRIVATCYDTSDSDLKAFVDAKGELMVKCQSYIMVTAHIQSIRRSEEVDLMLRRDFNIATFTDLLAAALKL